MPSRATEWAINRLVLALSLSLLAAPVWAAEPQSYPPGGTLDFLGLDDTSAPTQVQDGRAQDLQNVKLDLSKSLQQRFGINTIGDSLDVAQEDFCAVTGLYYTKFSSGTERIVSTCGNRFSYLNGTTWSQVNATGIIVSTTKNDQFVWATAYDTIIGTNASDPPLIYNGTTVSALDLTTLDADSRPTAATTLAFFKNFLILGNTTENGVANRTRIRWANVGTISTWDEDDYLDIGALGGQEITAMAELYDNLYIFLTDSIYRLSFVAGADTFNVSKVTDDIGCIAKNSVQSITLTNAQNGLIFLDKDKRLYFFNGIVVQDIAPLLTQTLRGLNAARLPYAVSADTGTDYYLCATNGTASSTNNLCLDFQYQIGEWTKHTNIPANAMAGVLDANGRAQTYVGSYKSFVYQLEDTSLHSDVGTISGIVTAVSTYSTDTISASQVLYNTAQDLITGAFVGAPLELTCGTGAGQTNTVAYNTVSGLVVTDPFSPAPTASTCYEVGTIDSSYTTKWYDLGLAARLKHFGELYFWAEGDADSTLAVSYAVDLNSTLATESVSLSPSESDSIWGSAIWGTSLWGGASDVFRQVKLDSQGRYFRAKFTEDDAGETFHLYDWAVLFWPGDTN